MIEIGAVTELAAVEQVRVLHVAAPAALCDHARVVGTFDRGTPIAVQAMMNIHPALRIVDVAAAAVRARANGRTVSGMNFAAAGRRRVSAKIRRGAGMSGSHTGGRA